MPKTLPLLALTMVGLLGLAGCERENKMTTTIADSAVESGAAFDTRVNPAPVETVGRPPADLPPPLPPSVATPDAPQAQTPDARAAKPPR